MFLSPAELVTLTECPQRARQIAWLRRYGWRFAISAKGNPRVSRAYFDKRMAGIEGTPEPSNEPDFTALTERA
jgi:hypothetical protein